MSRLLGVGACVGVLEVVLEVSAALLGVEKEGRVDGGPWGRPVVVVELLPSDPGRLGWFPLQEFELWVPLQELEGWNGLVPRLVFLPRSALMASLSSSWTSLYL